MVRPSNAAKQATVQPDRVEPFVKAPTTSQDLSKTNSVPTASVPGPSTAAEQPNSRPARVPSATTPRISQGPNNFYMWPSARSAKETVAALYGLKNRSQVTGSSSRLSQSEATSIPSRSSQSGSRTSIQPVVQVAVAALHQNIDSLRGSDTDSSGETSPPPNSRLTTRPNLGPRPSSSTQPSSQPSSVVPPAMTLRRSQESNQNSNQPTARVSAARANSGPGPSNEVDAVRSSIEKADFRLITNPHSNPTSSVQDDPTEMIVVTREVLDLRGMQGNAKVLFCLSENSESPELQGQPSSPAGNMTAQSLATSNPGSGNNQLLRSLPTLSLVETSYVKYLEDELVRLKHESAEQDKKQKKTKEELSKAKIMAKEESLAKEKLTSEIRSLMQKNNLFDQLMLELSGNFFARDAQITQQLVTTSNHLDQYWLTVRQLQGRIAYMEGGVQAVLEESIQARENEDWRTSQPGPSGFGERPASVDSKAEFKLEDGVPAVLEESIQARENEDWRTSQPGPSGLGKRPASDDSKEDEGQEKKKRSTMRGAKTRTSLVRNYVFLCNVFNLIICFDVLC
ncbi:hypothetical protein L596_001197 [Steinernema carpocapsae]|uniref:Uncharacterized protein n=1 Tax=Steinernema carpocapsae TaxID=34508 RepID=A0A4U8UL39_STECR|nr:hypothetical protein L596_001197 [Steinernema carpocapsae]